MPGTPGGTPLRYRSGCLSPPKQHACTTLAGGYAQESRKIVGIAGFPGSDGEKRQQGEARIKESAGTGQSAGGLRRNEGAQNAMRAAVREAGWPGTPGGGPANHQGDGWPGGTV